MRSRAMIPLSGAPLGFLLPRAAVIMRRLVLKRSRPSEASAERNEMLWTKPVDSVHNVTRAFSISDNNSNRRKEPSSLSPSLINEITPETPRIAIMTTPIIMQQKLMIVESTSPAVAYVRLIELRSWKSVAVAAADSVLESSGGFRSGSYGRRRNGCQFSTMGLEEADMKGMENMVAIRGQYITSDAD